MAKHPFKPVKTPLTQKGHELVLMAANIVYDPKGIAMIHKALQSAKGKQGICAAVAMAATTILHSLGDKFKSIPENEAWGKGGVVHCMLDAIMEVSHRLGFKLSEVDLKPIYQMVEKQLKDVTMHDNLQRSAARADMAKRAQGPMRGAMPPQGPQGPPQGPQGQPPQGGPPPGMPPGPPPGAGGPPGLQRKPPIPAMRGVMPNMSPMQGPMQGANQ